MSKGPECKTRPGDVIGTAILAHFDPRNAIPASLDEGCLECLPAPVGSGKYRAKLTINPDMHFGQGVERLINLCEVSSLW